MNLKNSLSEDELNSLIERLSKRRDELEGRVTIDSVKESLKELGLLHLFSENDIKEVRKQVSREFARKQWKNQFTLAIILIIIIAPLSAFGGYKLREYLVSNFPQLIGVTPLATASELEELEKQVESGNKRSEEKVKELENTKVQLEVELINYQQTNDLLKTENDRLKKEREELKNNPNPGNLVQSPPGNSSQKIKYEGFVFELQSCKRANVNADSQSIHCALLITSTEKNADLTLYAGSGSPKSRMVEAGKIYLATKAQFGTSSSRSGATENLIKDVPIKGYVTFDGVSLEVNKIQVMEIFFWSDNKIRLEFRDVPLSE
ncbi:MAG: hypothetical protein F6K54_13935 [Okeania sp. SIO3B5]|uniref:hypothetical protein n=1 Tax=Okeania sp. SIO3B5 TaxID=2607811 RepID=UPI0014012FA3|nr:hypothetical protein [Okeania sp. SIO3B5]NEO54082.1 hypothetical protein [Okeania sp. SIO3B5]